MSPATWVDLFSIVSGLVAAVMLVKAGEGVPWRLRTFKSESDRERRIEDRQRFYTGWGLGLLFLAFFFQAIVWVLNLRS